MARATVGIVLGLSTWALFWATVLQLMTSSVLAAPGRYSLIGDAGWQPLTSEHSPWMAESSNGSVQVPAVIPGQIHLDLERAGVIGDTYFRFNAVQDNTWVRQESWTFHTNFSLSTELISLLDTESSEIWLVFDGVDTIANVFVDEAPPLPPPDGWLSCFTKHESTLPDPREPYARQLSQGQEGCAAACLAEEGCGGFSMVSPSGPTSDTCWLYNRPAHTPTSNATGFRDGDWYSRQTRVSCITNGGFQLQDQFLRYALPIGSKLRAGRDQQSHNLTVQVHSTASLNRQWAKVRKEPSNFGYDWSPDVETQGIWLPVYLVGQAQMVLLDTIALVRPAPSEQDAFRVSVTTRVNLTSPAEIEYTVAGNWSGAGASLQQSLSLPAGVTELNAELSAADIEKWWPVGYGEQPMYTVQATVSCQHSGSQLSSERQIGFRTVALVASAANATHPPVQIYKVNNVNVFAKGADWVPPDSFESRSTVSDESLCALLESVRAANMNFLRVWGGGVFPQDGFFDCADQMGILIEQDHIFSDAVYATDAEFLQLVGQEVQYQARRLASHPSLFLWSGSNEEYPKAEGGWWDTVFLQTVFPNLTAIDSSRPVWAACPALPWVTGVDASGLPNGEPFTVSAAAREHYPVAPAEAHAYWFDLCSTLDTCQTCVDDSFYQDTVFASEYGWIGMPSLESLSPVLGDPEEDYTLLSPAMQARENTIFHQSKVYNMVLYNFGAFAEPYLNQSSTASFRRAIHLSMISQSDCLRAEAEHYRRGRDQLPQSAKPRTGGSIYWMLDDNWPAPSWTSLEYGGRRKLLHYEAKRFYAPLAISSYCLPSIHNCTSVQIHVTSDLSDPLPQTAAIRVNLTRWADGFSTQVLAVGVDVAAYGGGAIQLGDNELATALERAGCASVSHCFMTAQLVGSNHLAPENHQWLTMWRDAKLAVAAIQIQFVSTLADGAVELSVTSNNVAPLVMIHCKEDSDFGWFDDNGLLIAPGTPVRVIYTPRQGPYSRSYRPCSVASSFYAVSINAA